MRHRVADRVGDVDRRRALLDRRRHHLGCELELGARRVHRRELDVLDELARVCDGGAGLPEHVLARGRQLVHDVDVGGRDEGVDPRPLGVRDGTGGRLDVGEVGAREPGDDRTLDVACDLRTASWSPGEAIGKPASITSTPRRASCWAISSFSAGFSEMPGDCSPSRSVVSKISTRSVCEAMMLVLLFGLLLRLLLGWVCGYAAATRYSPRGGRRRSRREPGNIIRAEA